MNAPNRKFKHSREQWLLECAGLIMSEIIEPVWPVRESLKYRVAVGLPKGNDTKTLGVCYPSSASSDGHNEIFISPIENDSLSILSTLIHELIHAVDDCKSGHQGAFVRLARLVGLEGKPTSTVSGSKLLTVFTEYTRLLGDIPHSTLNLSALKRQKSRNIKVACSEACGFTMTASQTQIDRVLTAHGEFPCFLCGNAMTVNPPPKRKNRS